MDPSLHRRLDLIILPSRKGEGSEKRLETGVAGPLLALVALALETLAVLVPADLAPTLLDD
jgi:hypothetical protein